MNIAERHICAYVVECLTGEPGENPDYTHAFLANNRRLITRNRLLQKVMLFLDGKDPAEAAVRGKVRRLVLRFLDEEMRGEA